MKIEGLLLQKPPQKKLAFMFLGTYLERKCNMARLSAVGEGGSNRYLTICIARHLKTVFPIEHRSRPPSVPIGFVPQKLGLIWWVPWECKNLGELNFHMENGLPEAQKLPNRYYHMSRSQENWSEFFLFTIGVVGGTFLEVIAQIYSKGENCSICGSVSVFVR